MTRTITVDVHYSRRTSTPLVTITVTPHWLLRALRLQRTESYFATPLFHGARVWVREPACAAVPDDVQAAIDRELAAVERAESIAAFASDLGFHAHVLRTLTREPDKPLN